MHQVVRLADNVELAVKVIKKKDLSGSAAAVAAAAAAAAGGDCAGEGAGGQSDKMVANEIRLMQQGTTLLDYCLSPSLCLPSTLSVFLPFL